jgi:hypothetical protein
LGWYHIKKLHGSNNYKEVYILHSAIIISKFDSFDTLKKWCIWSLLIIVAGGSTQDNLGNLTSHRHDSSQVTTEFRKLYIWVTSN